MEHHQHDQITSCRSRFDWFGWAARIMLRATCTFAWAHSSLHVLVLMLNGCAGSWQQLGASRESSPVSFPASPCTGDIYVLMTPYLPLLVLVMQEGMQMHVRGACCAVLCPGG